LSRHGNEEEESADPDAPKKAARVGTKSNSNRLNITNTIEKNVDMLNAVKVDHDHVVDPVFQQMSIAFDEGGAKGMLLSNLRVNQHDCCLVFASLNKEKSATSSVEGSFGDHINATSLCADLDLSIADTMNDDLTICPALKEYRETLHIADSNVGIVSLVETMEDMKQFLQSSAVSGPISLQTFATPVDHEAPVPSYADYNDCDDFESTEYPGHNDGNYTEHDGNDDVESPILADKPSIRNSSGGASKPKIQWSAVFGDAASSESRSSTSQDSLDPSSMGSATEQASSDVMTDWEQVPIVSNNDYAFVNLDVLNKANAWAGAKHWKYATRSRLAAPKAEEPVTEQADDASASMEDVEMEEKKKTSKKSSKKDKFNIDFLNMSDSSIDRSIFVVSEPTARSKSDPTQLTAAAIEKMEASADDLLLPADARISIQDLCRLFILPNLILPPPPSAEVLRKAVISVSKVSADATSGKADIIWGQSQYLPSQSSSSSNRLQSNAPFAEPEDFHDYDLANDEGFNYDTDPVDSMPCSESDSTNSNGLVKATRIVEKIQVK
jgi:hypothetical protein